MDVAAEAAPATEVPVPRIVAALRRNRLALARARADGAHPYFVPVSHTPIARQALGAEKLLIPEQAVVVNTDPEESRRIARDHAGIPATAELREQPEVPGLHPGRLLGRWQ